MKASLFLICLLGVVPATAASTLTEPYTGSTTVWSSSSLTDCDDPTNLGGACFWVPPSSSVEVTVMDASGTSPGFFWQTRLNGGGFESNGLDCSGITVTIPTSANQIEVVMLDPAVSTLVCGPSVATTGEISVRIG